MEYHTFLGCMTNKMADNEDGGEKGGSKGMAIFIFIVLCLLLIAYAVYMFEAFTKSLFPFVEYNPELSDLPPNTVFSLGKVIDEPVVDDDNQEELEDLVGGVLDANVAWYKGVNTAAIPVQGTVLGS